MGRQVKSSLNHQIDLVSVDVGAMAWNSARANDAFVNCVGCTMPHGWFARAMSGPCPVGCCGAAMAAAPQTCCESDHATACGLGLLPSVWRALMEILTLRWSRLCLGLAAGAALNASEDQATRWRWAWPTTTSEFEAGADSFVGVTPAGCAMS